MHAAPMHYAEFGPAPALRRYVAAYWRFHVGGHEELRHTVPLTGGALLTTAPGAGQAWLFGPRLGPLHKPVRPGDEFWGVHFWPGAVKALLHSPVLRERVAPAMPEVLTQEQVARLRTASEREACALLDAVLLRRVEHAAPLDDLVMRAVFSLIATGGQSPIAQLARQAGLSPRQFRRRFVAATELLPKELARLRRVRAAVTQLVREPDTWATIAVERGYADQAHLAREFQQLLGVPPTTFGRHVRRITHGRVLG